MNLETADTGQRARRGANFGREVGERGEIVAEKSGRIGELAAGDLHAVARVAAEADDRVFDGLATARQGFSDR